MNEFSVHVFNGYNQLNTCTEIQYAKLYELVYVYNKKDLTGMFPDCMELFTGTLPVNTESGTGIVPANNLFQNKSSGNIKLT